ncbi:MAG TPA: toprim domain-containing protein [Anaerovoracaceae bacterium]|nr:toprim domain-containing protein [Anaerovoracaceae bacterium]
MNTSGFIKRVLTHSDLYSNVVGACKELLKSSLAAEAKDYLDSRVFENNQKLFGFGYFPNDDNLGLLIDKVGLSTLKTLGLVYPDRGNTSMMRGLLSQHNLIMPIKDDYGNIVALVGRTLLSENQQKESEVQKYKYTNGYKKSSNLFGLYYSKKSIRKNRSVIIVEGQIDYITCHSHGFHNVVALGGSSMSDYQMYLLLKYGQDLRVNLLLDNDIAGRKGQQKIIDKFSRFVNINPLALPEEYKDVDQYLRKGKDTSVLCV